MLHLKILAVLALVIALGGIAFQNCAPARYEAKPGPCTGDDCPQDPKNLEHTWKYDLDWSACSVSCGGGTQVRDVWCEDHRGRMIEDEVCGSGRPSDSRECNLHSCESMTHFWVPDAWGSCSGGTQSRNIDCYAATGEKVDVGYCTGEKPPAQRNCTQSVYNTYVQEVPATHNQVDIFLVIDDSTSMEENQKKLANRFGHFTQRLSQSGLNWQACFTTTDVEYYKGAPVLWEDHNSHILRHTKSGHAKIFRDSIMAVGTGFSNDEQGIKATHLAVLDNKNHKCFRSGAALSVIILSDEDERSVGNDPSLSNVQYVPFDEKNYPENLIKVVKKELGANKRFNVNSIIVKDEECMAYQDAQGTPSFIGRTYAQLSNLTGGFVGDICSDDYTENLRYFQDVIEFDISKVNLGCSPVSNSIEVTVVPPVSGLSYELKGKEMSFSPVLPNGTRLVVNYVCTK